MARWKKPTKEETYQLRQALAESARQGALRFPDAVAEIRKSVGMTQESFAKLVGLTRRQVAEIEVGTANPTVETLDKIGRLFGFTIGFVPRKVPSTDAEVPSQRDNSMARNPRFSGP